MSQESAFGRLIVPLVVPFKENEDIDFEKLENLTEVQLEANYCDSLVIGGTTSEFPALAFEERLEIIRCVANKVDRKVPVIAGTGLPSTRETIELTQKAEEIGVDVAVVIVPYYQRPSQEGIYEHYKAIAESTSLPIMLYNMPFFTGVNIEPSTFKRLAQIKNIIGIKEEAGLNPIQITQFINDAPEGFMFYDGDDSMILPVLIQGAIGAVAGGALVIGKYIKEMMDVFFGGEMKKAISIHQRITPFYKKVFGLRQNPIPMIKEALHQMGVDVGVCRRPLVMANEKEKKIINETLRQLGLI